jgi:hypothetical protein
VRKAALLLPFVLVLCASAQAGGTAPPAAPANLTAFLLRSTEPETHSFPRTPSFAWTPVRRAARYELELATNQGFAEGNVLWSEDKLRQPVAAIPLQLPWMVGKPYALWVHVRAIGKDGKVSPWSAPFGFNMRWRDSDVPQKLPAPPGLVRWAPVEGATAYDVLYPDIAAAKAFQTTTNVADEREFYTFHDSYAWTVPIHWRVRAVRFVDATIAAKNGLPRVSYGPWSPLFTSVNPPASLGPLTPNVTVSDEYVKAGETARPHELTPGFAWSGTAAIPGYPAGSPLYRVYISTDDHCVNRVFSGAVVGSPAYAPRTKGGPMTLPQNTSDLTTAKGGLVSVGGSEGAAFDATGDKVLTNEDPGNAVDKDSAGGSGSSSGSSGGGTGTADAGVARVDLWDSGWPNGRYYWTVVPVEVLPIGKAAKPEDSQPLEYHDMSVPQDACESGRLGSFGKVSKPVVAESSTPFASGLSPTGRMIAAATTSPTFHSSPLVAWEPATGATTYEVQWSKGAAYPWKTAGSLQTHATSAVLPLTTPATWWYRVRGINPALPTGAQKMTWSAPVALRLTGDQYRVLR